MIFVCRDQTEGCVPLPLPNFGSGNRVESGASCIPRCHGGGDCRRLTVPTRVLCRAAVLFLGRSAQLELEAVQIRVKAANSAVNESKQYLDKLPDYLKDVEKALVPLRK